MAARHQEILDAGGRVVAIDIDTPAQHAAMVEKLDLPFPFLSDPDRSGAIEPWDLANPTDRRNLAVPALVVVAPDGQVAFRAVSIDYADREHDEAAIAALRALGLPAATADTPARGTVVPGPHAMPFDHMEPYFRGARFAVSAMASRHPEIGADAERFVARMDEYRMLTKELAARRS